MPRLGVVAVLASGCGSIAEPSFGDGEQGDDSLPAGDVDEEGNPRPERPDIPPIPPSGDGEVPPDAPPGATQVLLSQTTDSTNVEIGATVLCWTCPAGTPTHIDCIRDLRTVTTTNRYFRSFPVAAPFTANQIHIGLEYSSGPQTLFARLYALNGPLGLANLVPITDFIAYTIPEIAASGLGSATALAPGVYNLILPNVAVAAGTLVVEVSVPDGRNVGTLLVVGSNSAGQSASSSLVAPDCGVFDITSGDAIRPSPPMNLLLSVEGFAE